MVLLPASFSLSFFFFFESCDQQKLNAIFKHGKKVKNTFTVTAEEEKCRFPSAKVAVTG